MPGKPIGKSNGEHMVPRSVTPGQHEMNRHNRTAGIGEISRNSTLYDKTIVTLVRAADNSETSSGSSTVTSSGSSTEGTISYWMIIVFALLGAGIAIGLFYYIRYVRGWNEQNKIAKKRWKGAADKLSMMSSARSILGSRTEDSRSIIAYDPQPGFAENFNVEPKRPEASAPASLYSVNFRSERYFPIGRRADDGDLQVLHGNTPYHFTPSEAEYFGNGNSVRGHLNYAQSIGSGYYNEIDLDRRPGQLR
ncbi:uncharacterized protein V1510DRAFT_410333 [Dipodascopsis tothii]|uniref:uncharacterized protein n=1 Tax=Dipodascopsis tothii TaxID=44089 RepID=UPI0034CD5D1A